VLKLKIPLFINKISFNNPFALTIIFVSVFGNIATHRLKFPCALQQYNLSQRASNSLPVWYCLFALLFL